MIFIKFVHHCGHDSVIEGYGLHGRGSILKGGVDNFSCTMTSLGQGSIYPSLWVMRPEREADYSVPSSAEM
jgi:hypothetical protein